MSSESQSLVVFMKILDPSGRMTDMHPRRALIRRSLLRRQILGDKDVDHRYDYEKNYRHIGSTVVLSVPIGRQPNVPRLMGIPLLTIISLVDGLAALSLRHVYLGGVMSLGVIHTGLDALHGPGLTAAQQFFEILPPYPRIVIDPHLLRSIERDPLLHTNVLPVDDEMSDMKSLLMRESDGLWCIDYLHARESRTGNKQEYIELLDAHKRSIEANMARAREFDRTALAMNWLATYHDRVVERQEDWLSPDEVAALRIAGDAPFRFEF
jgi:hypothetical protein